MSEPLPDLTSPGVRDISEKALIDEVQRRPAGKFVQLSPDQIAAAVAQVHARFEHSRVRDFVPLLVERRASRELAGQNGLVAASG
jgi:hypothetical protein